MKLVELLAREWSEWPGNCDYAVCDSDGEIRAIGTGTNNDFYPATAVDLEDRLNGTALLVSDDGKLVTRSGWAAERARIAKPDKKADKDGWILHRGGKCPVDGEIKVETRQRGGQIVIENAQDFWWEHRSNNGDIMAYRLHKQAEQVEACSKPDPRDSAKRDSDYVCWMRDRIAEIDVEVQARTVERAELVQKLASEGFALIGRVVDSAVCQPDPGRWMIGDSVECVSSSYSFITVGTVYKITGFDRNMVQFLDDDGTEMEYERANFKFHSRPSA